MPAFRRRSNVCTGSSSPLLLSTSVGIKALLFPTRTEVEKGKGEMGKRLLFFFFGNPFPSSYRPTHSPKANAAARGKKERRAAHRNCSAGREVGSNDCSQGHHHGRTEGRFGVHPFFPPFSLLLLPPGWLPACGRDKDRR